MAWPPPTTLSGTHARLVPLDAAHHDGLCEAAHGLEGLWYTAVPTAAGMRAEIARRLGLQARGTMLPFTVLAAATGKPLGMTTYMNIEAPSRRLEIGSTWYSPAVQRTPLNTECKLLLLRHAFDDLGCIAVEFRTHFFNQQSRRAIERLGAKLDGILRNHQIVPNGSLRDTCVYSIIPGEWPAVRAHLEWQLAKPRGQV